MNKRRVVVTGLGLVSPIGNDVKTSFQAAIEGKNGIDKVTLFDTTDWKVKIAGEVKNLNFEDFIEKKSIKRQDRVINLALVAAKEAYEWAISKGIAKEVARAVLPEGNTMSRLYVNGTLRSWVHYVELRSANGTQKEHIEVARECAKAIAQAFPLINEFCQE
jgi:flavin-dependent thymidylate synthase